MHWIGIDVSKAKLDVALLNDQGAVLDELSVHASLRFAGQGRGKGGKSDAQG